jgi:methyl-accepting chemotaxis protein
MALKFVIALSLWISVVMVVGTLFVARVLLSAEERSMQVRGREIGAVLGKAAIDRLVTNDIMGLNLLVEEVVRSGEAIVILFVNMDGVPITNARASFDSRDDGVKKVLAASGTEDVAKLVDAVREELDPVEVSVPVMLESTRLGTVRLLFSRAGVRKSALYIVLLLAGTSMVIVLSLSLLVYLLVRRSIVAPIAGVVSVTTRVAEGDLTEKVLVSSNDEIGYLGRGLNRMIIGLKDIIGNVRGSAGHLHTVSGDVTSVAMNVTAASRVQSESVDEAASSVNEMHFSLQEIASTVEDLNDTAEQTSSAVIETAASVDEVARTMNELSSSIEETSTAITQMSAAIGSIAENVEVLSTAADHTASSVFEVSASVRQVEDHAKESAALAEAVSADAQQIGMRSIEKTREGMRRIEEETRRSADVINRLGTRAENIGGILTVIEDITDQTSLLALNAAILAAQAGEHGKGFAVVAAEIRDLANRTASSTHEIGSLIQSVQEETREAVEVMQKGVLLAEEGTRLVQDTGDAFRKITERADQSRAMSHTISRAAADQSAGMRQVTEAVDRINQMAHHIARATAEQRSGSEQIIRASEKMRDITRFVRRATAEQVKASRTITDSMETVTTKVSLVNRAASEVRTGSDLIVKAIDRIKSTARENMELSARLSSAVEVMSGQADALQKEIARFTIGGEGE